MKVFAVVFLALACPYFMVKAQAQDGPAIQAAMNNSQLCSPIKMSLKDLAGLIGVNLPALIPDTNLGIDKNRHVVSNFAITATSASISGTLGCQPSDEAVPFKPPFNLNPDNFRLTDNFNCSAVITNKQVTSMNCTTSGEIGKVIAKSVNINDQMRQILQSAIQ